MRVARDPVALFERNDLGFGASGNSTGFIHGGPRYLTSNPDLTEQMCRDSGVMQRIAPHLLFRVPVLVPVLAAEPMPRLWVTLYDAFFGAYDRFQRIKRGKPHVRLTADELRQLEPGLARSVVGGVTFDEWGIDGARLCVANARDAAERGALVRTHCSVTEIMRDPTGRVMGVRYEIGSRARPGRCMARAVVNATGAWAPLTARLAGLEAEHARVRPGKGIHVDFDRRLSNYAIVTRAIDGRQVFVFPWQNFTVVGTTDDDYYGDLDDVVATGDEVRYLLEAARRVYPAISEARAIGTWAGVRPTLYAWGPNEDALSREHRIVDHAEHGAERPLLDARRQALELPPVRRADDGSAGRRPGQSGREAQSHEPTARRRAAGRRDVARQAGGHRSGGSRASRLPPWQQRARGRRPHAQETRRGDSGLQL